MDQDEEIPELLREANEEFDRLQLEIIEEGDDNDGEDIDDDDDSTPEDEEELPRLIRIANYYYNTYIKRLPDDKKKDIFSLNRIAKLYDDDDEDEDSVRLVSLLRGKNPQDLAFDLIISYPSAEGLDGTRPPDMPDRPASFKARFWTEPGDGNIHITRAAAGADPRWNYRTRIEFEELIDWGCMYVEVIRVGFQPSTSRRESILGKTRIPFPDIAEIQKKIKRPLVMSDTEECVLAGGVFQVFMQWKKRNHVVILEY